MRTLRTRRASRLRTILPAIALLVIPALTPLSAMADTDLVVGGNAVIAYANGDDVRLRSNASSGASIVGSYPEGTSVEVLDGPVTADDGSLWYHVSVDGTNGYIVSDWLASSAGLLQEITGDAWTTDSVNVRSGPSLADDTVTSVGAGTALTLTGQTMDNWISVNVNGADGWIYSAFLTQNGADSGSDSTAGAAGADASQSGASTDGATGTWHTNDSVNLRSGPSLGDDVITQLAGSTDVDLTGAIQNGFAQASTDSGNGWISQDYLAEGAAAHASAQEAAAASVSTDGPTGAWHTNDSVNLRADANAGSSIVDVLSASTDVTLTGSTSNGFAQVETASGTGWISQDFLSQGSAHADSSAQASTDASSTANASSGDGQALVNYAMQFLGEPYVWAGNQPGGFDCSGLTEYVVENVLGYDIGHGTAGQTAYGTPVAWGDWQPGDLIFFQNTYEAGISHVGIYIGNGQMINAENESTGVTISDVTDAYYSAHYYGAYRLT